MAFAYSTVAKNSQADNFDDQCNSGTTFTAATLEFQTNLGALVASLQMSNPAFGNANQGVILANAIASDTNAAAGVISQAVIKDRDGNVLGQCTVGTSGADINLTSVDIQAGDTVSMDSLSLSIP